MPKNRVSVLVRRRTLLRGGLAAGAIQIASPFVVKSLAEEPIKIGLDNPQTGAFAILGKNELLGCELARDQINAKGGILGRKVELLIEDSTSDDVGAAVAKARQLIDRDKVNFLLGNINSALAAAMADVSYESGVFHVVPGGHADMITGTNCHWNVFRVCNTTRMEANAVAGTLIKTAGKRWYYITPDYAFGRTLQAGLEKACAALGGSKVGGDLTPLGTTDFSSALTRAQAANPDVIIFLVGGDDAVNALRQAARFGLDRKYHLAGAQQELEVLLGLPPEARIGTWVFEWYWKQPKIAHVNEFVDEIKKRSGHVPTARTWFGYAAMWTCQMAAAQAKSLDAVKMAKAMQGFKLPPEVSLMPDGAFYRAAQNQLIADLYVGNAQSKGPGGPEDLFNVTDIVKGPAVAGALDQTGCKMTWPT